MKAIFKLSVYVMACINKTPVSDKTATEVEFIADGLMQKNQPSLSVDSSPAAPSGIGASARCAHPTFIETLSLFDPELVDYMMLYVWDSRNLELEFVNRIFLAIFAATLKA